jgi:hypothetical protein
MGLRKMKVLLLVPKVAYERLLSACGNDDSKHRLLRNGVLEPGSNGVQQVRILCDSDKAKTILDLARETSPDILVAIQEIQNSPDEFASD